MLENCLIPYGTTKSLSGKMKLRDDKKSMISGISFFALFIIIFIACFLIGILKEGYAVLSLGSLVGIAIFIYLISLSPFLQNLNNYYIEFPNEKSLEDFRLLYKNKLVKVEYKIDENGRISFNDDDNLECISYADGSKMTNLTKNKIFNYFSLWLSEYDLLSE
ncbi:MAG: hypothetical protein IJS47_02445 [Clostridia bacterium]|nr:hypothetical protein [Clostridia bacterium]